MIKVDENDPVGEMEPSFPYRDVTIRRGVDMKELYNLEGEIGRGKFGTVYRCREKSTGLTLAAKFVGIARRQDRRNVEREVEIMRTLQHPRLIQLYDSLESENIMCVVLELIEGGELFERVIDDDFILTEKACTVFMRQICEGVAFIHQNSIIHLDLKPENILCLSKTGNRIKIIDFGLARKYEPDKKLQVLFGTPEFVAPEVVNFDEISFATDMWSVGVICYVLLSGLSPFMGETDVETMANVTIARFDYEDECFEEISKDAKDFISKLLVKDKKARLTAFESLSHPWLVRKIPPTPPSLETTKENLKQFVDKSLPMFRNHLFPRNEISNNKFGIVQNIIENGDKIHTPSRNEKIPLVQTFNLINKQNDTNDINKFNELMKNDSVIKFPELSKIMDESKFLDENDHKGDGFSSPEVSYKPSSQPINIPNKNKNLTGEIEQYPIILTNEIPNIEKLISKQKDIKMISPEKNLSEKEIFHRFKCTTDVSPKENSFPKIENVSENSKFTDNSNSSILQKDEIMGIQNHISEIKPLSLLSNSNLNLQYDFNKKDDLTKVVKSKFLNILDDENCALPTSSKNSIQNSSFLLPNDKHLNKNLPRGVEQARNFPETLFGIKENTSFKNESISFKQHLRSTPPWFSELKTQATENCKIDRFDRRSSDFSCFLNSKDDSESVSLADEIRKLSTRLLQISNSQTETENSVNNNPNPRSNDPISSFLANHGISNHRPKFKFSCMNRDVPIGSPPPPTNIAYYLNKSLNPNLDTHSAPQTPRRSPENSSNFMNKNVIIASELFQQSEAKNSTVSTETKKTISQKPVLPLIRMTGKDALVHKWLQEAACETALSKTKLKRYVIKRRWIKAVNTIIALQRMGAKLDD